MLGLKRNTVVLCDYDESWQKAAAESIEQLKAIFADAAVDIQHVGSTAIAGIKAKPILDIAVAVRCFADVWPLIPKLEENGFVHREQNDDAGQIFFSCGDFNADIRTHHIHVVLFGSDEWNGYLRFRDFLNSNPHRRREYEALKLSSMQKYPNDRLTYTNSKASFIQNVIAEAGDYQTLGRMVKVTVDRPLGSTHPKHKGMIYPVNYGYVSGVMAQDGEPQDAYILGVNEPVKEFSGQIIAIINRHDDVEDKWVVVPEHTVMYEPQIKAAVAFTEQYFNSSYKCLYEKSCGAVLYTVQDGERKYLLVTNRSGHIGFAKGHVEYGENEYQTASREIFEETGLQVKFHPGFRESITYTIYTAVQKEQVLFLASFKMQDITIPQNEISSYFLVNYEQAMQTLTYYQDRTILQKAEAMLNQPLF
ncbi:MAG TPA: GrpB family protein [Oscillospiraceae bacterium]|nr:GrpB family protein [Oscillospiraceae bacterium]